MKRNGWKTALVALVLPALLFCLIAQDPGAAWGAQKRLLRIATASTGGSWYPAGGAIAAIINKYITNTEASAHPSAASRENIRLLMEKKTELAMVMPDVAYFAQTATDIYKGKPAAKIAGLFSFWGIDLLTITRADTDIRTIQDLKGHKVGFGPPGSGSEVMSKKILAEYGITYKDLKPQFLSAPEQARALKDKTLHAAMYTIGTPAPTFVDLCTLTKCRLVCMEDEMIQKITAKHPYYSKSIIPAGSYPNVDYDCATLKWVGLVVVHKDFDEELAYQIVKAVVKDHLDEFKQAHAKAKGLTTESMFQGMSIPWHPGAARFWKEVGLLK